MVCNRLRNGLVGTISGQYCTLGIWFHDEKGHQLCGQNHRTSSIRKKSETNWEIVVIGCD